MSESLAPASPASSNSATLAASPVRLGVSACLMGQNVRFDGGHKLDHFLRDTLGAFVEFVPVCPETEAGFGIPREAMRLVSTPDGIRLKTVRSGRDMTEAMTSWAAKRVEELGAERLDGFVFKSKSPSSGMERVKVYEDRPKGEPGASPSLNGVGLFAKAFMEAFPLLPVEEEGRLHDPILRESFVERIFVHRRWRELLACGENTKTCPYGLLVDFHSRHKYLLVAHAPDIEREMGRLVAHSSKAPRAELYPEYEKLLFTTLGRRATIRKQYNVLQKLMGYFKKQLSHDEKAELLEVFDRYKDGLVPLVVPMTLVNHYVRKYDQPYLKEQWHLNPHPVELQLRNHV